MPAETHSHRGPVDRAELERIVHEQLAEILEVDLEAVTNDARLRDDLDADDYALLELAEAVEGELGDRSLLLASLAHRSWCAENERSPSNERLEFLGDSVLGLIVTHYVYENFPDLPEGQLSEVRAGVVNARVLAEVAQEIGLGSHLL